jgi:hypothetical protein
MNLIPETLDWVKERAACSIHDLFAKLAAAVEADVANIIKQLPASRAPIFEFTRFSIHKFRGIAAQQ